MPLNWPEFCKTPGMVDACSIVSGSSSIPAGMTLDGLPLAVQLVAQPGKEDVLLSVMAEIEGLLKSPASQ